MKRIKVLNIKTGKVVDLLETTYNGLVAAGKGKDFDLVTGASEGKKPAEKKEEPAKEEVENVEIPKVDKNEDGKRSAKEMISAIKEAETVEAVNVLVDGEDRSSVLKAAAKRKTELK